MTDITLLLNTFYHRLRMEKVQNTLLGLGVTVFDSQGEIRDSYLILMETIAILDLLWEKKEYNAIYDSIGIIIGTYNRTRFITYFLEREG